MLSKKDIKNLNKINTMLGENFQSKVTFKPDMDLDHVKKIDQYSDSLKKKVMETEQFNNYHKNKMYNKSLLLKEGVDILLNRKKSDNDLDFVRNNKDNFMNKKLKETRNEGESTKKKINHLENLYETYVRKNGNDKKAKVLSQRITELKTKVFEDKTSEKLKLMLSEDADRAEAIMTSKGLLDDVISLQSKISQMRNETLDSFARMITSEYSSETADQIRTTLSDSLQEVLTVIENAKDEFYNTVNVLTGDSEMEDSMEPKAEVGSLDDEGDEESEEKEDFELDLELGDEGEEDSDVESDEDSDEESAEDELDLEFDREDFERREE